MEYMQRQTDIALPALNRSDSKISTNIDASVSSNNPVNVNINFVLSERDKISGSGRRSFKNTMLAQMNSCLQRISSKVPIEIFAVFLEMSVLQTIAISLEIDKKAQDFEKSIILIIEKWVPEFYFSVGDVRIKYSVIVFDIRISLKVRQIIWYIFE